MRYKPALLSLALASIWLVCPVAWGQVSRAVRAPRVRIVFDVQTPSAPNERWPFREGIPSGEAVPSDNPLCTVCGSLEDRSGWKPGCDLRLDRDVTVTDFLGGRVKQIRVTRFRAGYKAPAGSFDEIRKELREVWRGEFRNASCRIGWAEMTNWNILSRVDFEGGAHAVLLTDGLHVEVVDGRGWCWFFRLRPAVD